MLRGLTLLQPLGLTYQTELTTNIDLCNAVTGLVVVVFEDVHPYGGGGWGVTALLLLRRAISSMFDTMVAC